MRKLNQQIFSEKENEKTKSTNFFSGKGMGIEKSLSRRTSMNGYVGLIARSDGNFWQFLVDLTQISCAVLCYL